MNEDEFEKKFKKVVHSVTGEFLDKKIVRKEFEKSMDENGKVSMENLFADILVVSIDYSNKLNHDLLKELFVDKK